MIVRADRTPAKTAMAATPSVVSAPDGGRGAAETALVVLSALALMLLVLAVLPHRMVAIAGEFGRTIEGHREMLAAAGISVCAGVIVTVLLGGVG